MAHFAGGVDIGLGMHCVNNLKSNKDANADRLALNYDLAAKSGKPNFAEMVVKQQAILDRVHCYNHKHLIKLESLAITMPEDVRPGDERKFFEAAKKYMDENFGGDRPGEFCVSATVHMNEKRPHMHYLFVPCCPNNAKKKKANAPKWKCCHNDVVNKPMLAVFHPKISEFISRELGYQVAILKNDVQDRQDFVNMSLKDFKAATKQKYVEDAKKEQAQVQAQTAALKKDLESVEKVASRMDDERVNAWGKIADEIDSLPSIFGKKVLGGETVKRLQENFEVVATDEKAIIARTMRLDAQSRELEETAKRQAAKDAEQAAKEAELIDREKAVVEVENLQKNLDREIDRKAEGKFQGALAGLGMFGYLVQDLMERAQRYAGNAKQDITAVLEQFGNDCGEAVCAAYRAVCDKWDERDQRQRAQERPRHQPQQQEKNLGNDGWSR